MNSILVYNSNLLDAYISSSKTHPKITPVNNFAVNQSTAYDAMAASILKAYDYACDTYMDAFINEEQKIKSRTFITVRYDKDRVVSELLLVPTDGKMNFEGTLMHHDTVRDLVLDTGFESHLVINPHMLRFEPMMVLAEFDTSSASSMEELSRLHYVETLDASFKPSEQRKVIPIHLSKFFSAFKRVLEAEDRQTLKVEMIPDGVIVTPNELEFPDRLVAVVHQPRSLTFNEDINVDAFSEHTKTEVGTLSMTGGQVFTVYIRKDVPRMLLSNPPINVQTYTCFVHSEGDERYDTGALLKLSKDHSISEWLSGDKLLKFIQSRYSTIEFPNR